MPTAGRLPLNPIRARTLHRSSKDKGEFPQTELITLCLIFVRATVGCTAGVVACGGVPPWPRCPNAAGAATIGAAIMLEIKFRLFMQALY